MIGLPSWPWRTVRRRSAEIGEPGIAQLRSREDALLRAEHVVVDFPAGRRVISALADVSIDLLPGETLGLVGESGSGKSTMARALLQLPVPSGGEVWLDGIDLTRLRGRKLRRMRPFIQVVLQDPSSSLNPRLSVRQVVEEPLAIWKVPRAERRRRVDEALTSVGLIPDEVADRRPHEFSGGQRQRISLARAIILRPRVLICDEPLSALDVSVQAQIVNLLGDLRRRLDLSMVFISHDLAAVRAVSDRVAVLYLGRLCEIGTVEQVFEAARHPYSGELLRAVPEVGGPTGDDAMSELTMTEPPSPADPPSGCRYRLGCSRAQDICAAVVPEIRQLDSGQFVACHFPLDRP